MPFAAVAHAARMAGPEFRAFHAERPDRERRELVEGVRSAVQRPGIALPWPRAALAEMDRTGPHRPRPDAAVVDYDALVASERFTGTAHLTRRGDLEHRRGPDAGQRCAGST
ncbi:hypothetical protein FF100_28205 [Methylobacterium terricola]|uniref:Uncharacterized protein n=1 Tax=Methylobacterium terricola TaxID=2583531 RepID=A0A5C4L983_9HYPH|nr:hypothetical protein [Methylobacterium terricola]TNC08938.1 hypothetical protein FF100_28205 [Methylobacterium terricola]